jgi:hypothetical protein
MYSVKNLGLMTYLEKESGASQGAERAAPWDEKRWKELHEGPYTTSSFLSFAISSAL